MVEHTSIRARGSQRDAGQLRQVTGSVAEFKSLSASWSSKSAPDEADLADGKQASLSCRITIASVWMSYVVFWQDEKAILDRPISQRHPYLA
jgi:hypothetical protein